jgi:hypothetical protein
VTHPPILPGTIPLARSLFALLPVTIQQLARLAPGFLVCRAGSDHRERSPSLAGQNLAVDFISYLVTNGYSEAEYLSGPD